MARNCPHFKIFETLDCLHQSGAGHKPAGPAKQKRLPYKAVGKTTGRLIRAERETKRAAGDKCVKKNRHHQNQQRTNNNADQAASDENTMKKAVFSAEVTAGQLLCGGLFATDKMSNWFSSIRRCK